MATLERVLEMQKQGMSESQISKTLMEDGISPREVTDAIGQSKIKAAVAMEQSSSEEMQPSIMQSSQEGAPAYASQENAPVYTQQNYSAGQAYSSQEPQVEAPQQQAQYPAQQQYQAAAEQYPVQEQAQYPAQQQYQDYGQQPQQYDQAAYGYEQPAYYPQQMDMETIKDIAKREIELEMLKIKQQVDSSTKASAELKSKIQIIETRLIKIEESMSQLQSAIIRKIGEYGETITGISNEIKATQQSFSKVLNPLLDKKRGTSNYSESKEQEDDSQENSNSNQPPSPKSERNKNSASFEDYFR